MENKTPIGLTAEDEITDLLDKRARALRARDLDTYISLFHPDFKLVAFDGQMMNREEFVTRTRQRWEGIQSFPKLEITIESLHTIDGEETAILVSNQVFTVLQQDEESGFTQEVKSSFLRRETWRHNQDGWKIQRIEELEHGATSIDGRVSNKPESLLRAG